MLLADDGSAGGLGFALAVVGVLVVVWLGRANDKKIKAAAVMRTADEQKYFQEVQQQAATMPIAPVSVGGVMAQRGEIFIRAYYNINQVVEHKQTEYRGRSQGISVRVAGGVTLRSGTYGGLPVVHAQMVVGDTGTLYLSSQRVLFVGAKHSISVPIAHVVAATDYLDAVKIDRTNAASLWFQTTEQNIAVFIRRIAAGQLDAQRAPVAPTT